MWSMFDRSRKVRIAVFASGNGTNFQALLDACAAGTINAEIPVLVTNKKHAYAITRARLAKIEPLIFEQDKYPSKTVWCAKIAKALKDRSVDLICLAGFMMRLEACMIRAFPNRIINIHPALLPNYGGKGMYGRRVHEAVLAAKEKESGCTVHLVDEIYDHGTILAQAKVKVAEHDSPESLAERIHPEEHKLYVSVVKDICAGKIDLDRFQPTEASKGVSK